MTEKSKPKVDFITFQQKQFSKQWESISTGISTPSWYSEDIELTQYE